MPRIEQKEAQKGSQKWLQILINQYPELLAQPLQNELNLPDNEHIHWLSPVKEDQYAEYQDETFLEKLGVTLSKRTLDSFWPKRGPVWDALGRSGSGKLLLVEAKAHIGELVSSPSGASQPSLAKIRKSLDETKQFLSSNSQADWSTIFYQYTNRLAHLYLLHQLNELPVYLVFLYFINDEDVNGPDSKEEWKGAIELIRHFLGIKQHELSQYVVDIFIDVERLK